MQILNKKYWKKFYQKEKQIGEHTDFATCCWYTWLDKNVMKDAYLYDLGCGKGRDSYYFGEKGCKVVGVDSATRPISNNSATFCMYPLETFMRKMRPKKNDIIYSRFFLHSITPEVMEEFVNWSKGWFMAEYRAEGDVPKLYPDHDRYFVKNNELINMLIARGFDIKYFTCSHGLAVCKDEDPLIGRIIARKI